MIKNRIFRNAEWFLVLFTFVLGVSIAFRSQTAIIQFFSTDDAYYYFQTARNAVSGHGLSFDGIARGNGYHPLWMLICLPVFTLSAVNVWLPLRVLVVIQSGLFAASGYFLFRFAKLVLPRSVSLVLMAVWLFSTSIYRVVGTMGMESGVTAFFLIVFLYGAARWEQDDPLLGRKLGMVVLGGLAALLLLSRLDTVFVVGLMGMWLVLKGSPFDRRLVLIDIVLAAGTVIFAYAARSGLTSAYYNMTEAIKMMTALALVAQPLALLLLGGSRLRWIRGQKFFMSLVRWSFGTLAASVLIAVVVMLRFPNGGYSRAAFALQSVLFTGLALGVRVLARWLGRKSGGDNPTWQPFARQAEIEWAALVRRGLAYFVPLGGSLGAFLLFNRLYFGVMMPISGKIKMWWGSLDTVYGRRAGNLMTFFGLEPGGAWHSITNPLHWLADRLDAIPGVSAYPVFVGLLVVLLVALAMLVWCNPAFRNYLQRYALLPLLAGAAFHTGNYMMTGYVGCREWYWQLETIVALLLTGLVLGAVLSRWREHEKFQTGLAWVSMGIVAVLGVHFLFWQLQIYPIRQTEAPASIQVIEELMTMTEPGSTIGMTGSGEVGYFIENRRVINMDGLINGEEYFQHLQSFTIHEYLEKINVDYIYSRPYVLFESDPYKGTFDERVSEIGWVGDMVLYHYLPGVER